MQIGRLVGDPRSTGLGLWLLAAIAILFDSYAEALDCSEQALAAAITPYDRLAVLAVKAVALVMLRRVAEALPVFEEHHCRCLTDGFLAALITTEPFIGRMQMQGNIGAGIKHIEAAILTREGRSSCG